MTATIEETRTELVRLIDLAQGGEEIVITRQGEPVAKLTGIRATGGEASSRSEWLKELRELREKTSTGNSGRSAGDILAEDRAERSW